MSFTVIRLVKLAPLPSVVIVAGDIPSSLGKLSVLVILDLSCNKLSGESLPLR